jgi:hypothetical protein
MDAFRFPDTLADFDMRSWADQRFGQGCTLPHDGATMEVVPLAVFDHDWEVHAFVQVWMYGDSGWQYGLLFASAHGDHVPSRAFDWGYVRPSFAEVAACVDRYVAALREHNALTS